VFDHPGSLTVSEIILCALALFGIVYNSYHMAHKYLDQSWYPMHIVMYAVFVVLPHLVIVFYAFTKMVVD
jgi:hypothetical protein